MRKLLPAALLVALAALWGFRSPQIPLAEQAPSTNSGQEPALPVEVAVLESAAGYTRRRHYSGLLRAARKLEVGFEVAGRVLAVHVDEGVSVTNGEPIATLDGARLQAARAEQVAALAAAQASLDEAVAGPRPEAILRARAQTQALAAELELATKRLARRRGLLERQATSAEEVDAASSTRAALRAKLDGAHAQWSELEQGTRKERIAAARADVARIAAGIASLDLDLEDLVLRAPFAGSISIRHVDEGAIVRVGQAGVTLVEVAALEAWIGVPPEDVADFTRQSPTVSVRSLARAVGPWRALPELDVAARTVQVVLPLLPSSNTDLRPGELAEIVLERYVPEEGYWIPTLALSQGVRGLWSCFVLPAHEGEAGTRVLRASLEVLHVAGNRSFVRGTLAAGDRVVLSGPQRIVSGQLVRAASAETQER